ncbi:hypothetical protein EPD62_001260 [Acetivibrio thermocellus]|uniref:hypothetical protein n=1 Tax=Acetivibrio thermocellus TaxID=1515 RepID=UPI0010A6B192|nr:hypothetical protein [Acetivibrio thermocellus]THJ78292.1 hypothetical protein EPD62_06855 [Acetivibrio thermocellus]
MQEGNNGIIYSNVSGESRNSNNECDKLKSLTVSSHNERLGISRIGIKNNKFKNCGWEIYKVDLKAAQDFNDFQIYLWREMERIADAKLERQNNDIKDIFTYALRYSIPSVFYEIVLCDEGKGPQQVHLNDEEIERIMTDYNDFVKEKSCNVTDKFNHLTEHYSWKICEIDYYAATIFKNVSGLTYKEIMKNALRTYLNQISYNHAQEEIELEVKHIDEYLKEGERYE